MKLSASGSFILEYVQLLPFDSWGVSWASLSWLAYLHWPLVGPRICWLYKCALTPKNAIQASDYGNGPLWGWAVHSPCSCTCTSEEQVMGVGHGTDALVAEFFSAQYWLCFFYNEHSWVLENIQPCRKQNWVYHIKQSLAWCNTHFYSKGSSHLPLEWPLEMNLRKCWHLRFFEIEKQSVFT